MKIKYALLKKWCEKKLTNKEIIFLLHIARFQDDFGRVFGIYYRDVCNECRMSIQTFYDVLYSLNNKGIITYNRVRDDYDIVILENDMSYNGAYQEGYVNVSRKIFIEEKFRKLRANEKLLLLLFMSATHEDRRIHQIGISKFYKNYTSLLGVTKNILRTYLHSLKAFFGIWRKDGKYFIAFQPKKFKFERSVSETDQHLGHVVRVNCRRSKIKEINERSFKDTIHIIKQYRKEARQQGKNILELIGECIANSVQNMKNRNLNEKYVHKLMRQQLGFVVSGN